MKYSRFRNTSLTNNCQGRRRMPIPIILLDSGTPGTVVIAVNLTRNPVIRCPSPKAKRQTLRPPHMQSICAWKFISWPVFFNFGIYSWCRYQIYSPIFRHGVHRLGEVFLRVWTARRQMKCSPQPGPVPYVEKRRYVCLQRADETRAFGLESTLCRTYLML